jgi:hypothetical protein
MFIIHWMFDKLGYMPKINMEVGIVKSDFKAAWPFPEETPKKKPVVRKTTARKPAAKKVK